MLYAIAVTYFILICLTLNIFRRIKLRPLLFGIGTLLLLFVVSAVNTTYEIIDEKVASFVSFGMYTGDSVQIPFLLQYILAYVPFALFEYEYSAHGINMAVQAIVFVLGAQFIFMNRLHWLLYVFLLFPSYYHYSIFGLRDPLIALVSILVVISLIHLNKKHFVYMCLLFASISIIIRPELSMIILGFAGVRLFIDAEGKRRWFIVILGLSGLYLMLLILPLAFGISSTGSATGNIDLMMQFNELRANRRLGQDYGAGSHILGGQLYNLEFIKRYPIQVLSSFVAPLPVDIRGAQDIIAFLESMVFCCVVGLAMYRMKESKTALLLFVCGMVYMFLQAIFAANYGNILRIRYPAVIFFIASAMISILDSRRR